MLDVVCLRCRVRIPSYEAAVRVNLPTIDKFLLDVELLERRLGRTFRGSMRISTETMVLVGSCGAAASWRGGLISPSAGSRVILRGQSFFNAHATPEGQNAS